MVAIILRKSLQIKEHNIPQALKRRIADKLISGQPDRSRRSHSPSRTTIEAEEHRDRDDDSYDQRRRQGDGRAAADGRAWAGWEGAEPALACVLCM
jgi:hypothetical protein